MKTDILMNGSTVKNHISLKKGIRKQCNTENFVPIVVPGLSTSSSSSSHPSTSMTPSKQERNRRTSSWSSSSSPTTATSSDSETREREDQTEICEICQRTKITRASCRKRNSGVVLRAENFGDLITADHKILSEGCESRHNHLQCSTVHNKQNGLWQGKAHRNPVLVAPGGGPQQQTNGGEDPLGNTLF